MQPATLLNLPHNIIGVVVIGNAISIYIDANALLRAVRNWYRLQHIYTKSYSYTHIIYILNVIYIYIRYIVW